MFRFAAPLAAAAALAAPAAAVADGSQPIQPVTAQPVTPVTAQPITPVTAKPVTPVTAQPVTPVTAKPVTPVTAKPVKPTSSHTLPAPHQGSGRHPVSFFLGAWRTGVPGGTYVDTGGSSDNATQVTGTGTAARTRLVVSANGTWTWEGLTGRWTRTGDPDWPLVLHRGVDGHDWKVGGDPRHSKQIYLWDGYVSYYGKR